MRQDLYDKTYQLLTEIYRNMPDKDKAWFVKEHPINMHSDLGRHLRNHAGLWEVPHEPLIIGGVDCSDDHPDAISAKVIEDFQNVVKLSYSV